MFGGPQAGGDCALSDGRSEAGVQDKAPQGRLIAIRGGAGLGDALYLQAIARHLVKQGNRVEACCKWPDVFRPLGDRVVVSPFRRERIDRLAHYSMRRGFPETDQFTDCCIQAGLAGDAVDLRIDWAPLNRDERLARSGKPIVVVKMPQPPFDRMDGYGKEFAPDFRAVQRVLDAIGERAVLVQIGRGRPAFRYRGIHVDLVNATSVIDILDLASVAGGFIGQCSFLVPLAESFGKPALFVWSRQGLQSSNDVIKRLTPRKVLHRPGLSRVIVDDCSDAELSGAVDAFLAEIASPALV